MFLPGNLNFRTTSKMNRHEANAQHIDALDWDIGGLSYGAAFYCLIGLAAQL